MAAKKFESVHRPARNMLKQDLDDPVLYQFGKLRPIRITWLISRRSGVTNTVNFTIKFENGSQREESNV